MSGSLFVAAPPGVRWLRSLDDVDAFLRRQFPDAPAVRETMATSGEPYLDFDVRLADGVIGHGAYVERGNLFSPTARRRTGRTPSRRSSPSCRPAPPSPP